MFLLVNESPHLKVVQRCGREFVRTLQTDKGERLKKLKRFDCVVGYAELVATRE